MQGESLARRGPSDEYMVSRNGSESVLAKALNEESMRGTNRIKRKCTWGGAHLEATRVGSVEKVRKDQEGS